MALQVVRLPPQGHERTAPELPVVLVDRRVHLSAGAPQAQPHLCTQTEGIKVKIVAFSVIAVVYMSAAYAVSTAFQFIGCWEAGVLSAYVAHDAWKAGRS
jgi:hypothetical protein